MARRGTAWLAVGLALLTPVAAGAGGYIGPDPRAAPCAAGVPCTTTGVVVVQTQPRGWVGRMLEERPLVEHTFGRRCAYPARPSDSVFSGGAGYVIKQDVREAVGCAR